MKDVGVERASNHSDLETTQSTGGLGWNPVKMDNGNLTGR